MTHYTIQEWKAYIQGDELDRALMDTHLLECEHCSEIYLVAVEELHEDLPQLMNIEAFCHEVIRKIELLPKKNTHINKHTTNKKWYTNTFFHYTVAASLTIVLMGSGIFDQMFDRVSQISHSTEQAQKTTVSEQLTNKAGQWLDAIPTKKKEGKP